VHLRPRLWLITLFILLFGFATALSACGEDDPNSESSDDDDDDDDDDEDDDEDDDDDDEDDDDDDDDDAPASKKRAKATKSRTARRSVAAAGSAQGRAQQLKHWAPVHAFMGAPAVIGQVISSTEAIAVTKDNMVGVTTNAGADWSFSRNLSGRVYAVTGVKGGPYVAVGSGGSMSLSPDGKSWSDLPKHTGEDLIGAAMLDDTIIAVGKKGTALRISSRGTEGHAEPLPDKFKASAVVNHEGRLIAWKGKKGYGSKDGKRWRKLEVLPSLPGGKTATTSKGVCKLGRVGKKKGVSCEVKGVAHGAGGATFVENKGVMSVSSDGGKSWSIKSLGFKGVTKVLGSAGGPYYAIGSKGSLAVSQDGSDWTTRPLNATKTLRDGLVDGDTVLIVGDSGTIVRSGDGGSSWSVMPPTVSGALKTLVKRGSTYYASMGKKAISSTDGGRTWLEVDDPTIAEGLPSPVKPKACEGRLPQDGAVCKLSKKVTTPLGLPNVKAFAFKGDTGLAMGDAALVAFTQDGGATWQASNGFPLKRVQAFEVRGDVVVAVDKKSVVTSSNGGTSFKEAQIPKAAKGALLDVHITENGTVYAAGKKGIILKSEGRLDLWRQLNTGEKNKTKFTRLFEVGTTLFAAGSKGELYRSPDQGESWTAVPLGMRGNVMLMAGDDDSILALINLSRSGGRLLRSNDGGQHFSVQRSLHTFWQNETRSSTVFELQGDTITWAGQVSTDGGLSWAHREEVNRARFDLGNGVSAKISYGRMHVYGKDRWPKAFVLLPVYNGTITCDETSGCWLRGDGQVYRSI
jgi:photosystem II stability/assembly factor-like uncharacterized protein